MKVITTQERIEERRKKLRRLETELMRSGKMVAGAIIQRYTVCGKEGCRCLEGQRHGPYPALTRPNGKVVYLNRKLHTKIRPYVERYQSFQRDLSQWRRIVRELDELFCKLRVDQMLKLETVKSEIES